MKVIVLSVLLSCVFSLVPVFSGLGGGWTIIICGVISAGLGAYFFPLEMKDTDPPDDTDPPAGKNRPDNADAPDEQAVSR
jgi:hypothetical protein